MSTLREAAEKALALADEYARAAAKAYTESLYGTSKSYTAECVKDEAACRESLRAALAAPAPAAAPDETIDGKRIEEEAQHFFEWPDPKRRDTVTLTSCVIFAAKIAEMVRAELAKPDARPAPAEPQMAERGLRELLAYRFSGALLYHDDGELQDNSARPFIDFLRDSAETIKQKLMERAIAGLENLTNPPATAPQPAGGEPVAWIRKHPDGLYADELLPNWQIEKVRKESGAWVPLYTQAGERKPLTEEQITAMEWPDIEGFDTEGNHINPSSLMAFARAIEAAHGITATKGER